MALPLFCKRLGNDLGLEALFGIHLLEPLVFLFKLLHPGHQRGVHAAELGPPFVERGRAHAMLAAQFGDGGAGFSLFEDGDNLAVGVTGDLHAELSKSYLENSTHKSACLQGGITVGRRAQRSLCPNGYVLVSSRLPDVTPSPDRNSFLHEVAA